MKEAKGYTYYPDRPGSPYRVALHINGKMKYVGSFATPEAAREAYLEERQGNPSLSKSKWTDKEREKLIHLFTTTNMYHKEIAAEIGKTVSAVSNMIHRLREEEILYERKSHAND